MKWIILLAMVTATSAQAQLSENFDDGEFTSNPRWVGDTSSFVVNADGRLRSASLLTDHQFFLSTPSALLDAEWTFRLVLDFSTSSLNYIDVYLASLNADLLQNGNTGYFVRLGYAQDEVSLYRKDVSGEVKIIDGVDGSLAGSGNEVVVTVSRSPSGRFNLTRDIGATGNVFPEGSVTDVTYLNTGHFGFVVKQSSSAFFQKHYFDDITIIPFQPDTTAPYVTAVVPTGPASMDVEFSELVETSGALSPFNYSVDRSIGLPNAVLANPFNPKLFHLTFFNSFPHREELRLSVNGISDIAGNLMQPSTVLFSFFTPRFGDVVIHEIMADPSPPQRLPDLEWIELKNNSGFPLSIANWRLCKSASCITLPSYLLMADSMVAITSATRLAELSGFGTVAGVPGFFSLTNSGDQLSLLSPGGSVIHVLEFSDSWYGNDVKKQGGFSLEMIDENRFCLGAENWTATSDPSGGTPGKRNSVSAQVMDDSSPEPVRVFLTDSLHIAVLFSETLDSISAHIANYSINDGSSSISPASVTVESPLFNRVVLALPAPLERNRIYELSVSGAKDCAGNSSLVKVLNFGLPETAEQGDVLVNELLFDPFPGSVDFVELYNNSNKVFAMNDLFIANRNDAGEINSMTRISNEPILFMPGTLFVITESHQKLIQHYVCGEQQQFIPLFTPSMPDDKGEVVILNRAGEIIDEVRYTDDWHFPLITNKAGISLERISYTGASSDGSNWHSAASSHGFATPALENSQSRLSLSAEPFIEIRPRVISPNRDGQDDYACIYYGLAANGYTANLTIFDANGQLVRNLCRNELCGGSGFWKWDGSGEGGKALPAGVYILFIELLNPAGGRLKFKKAVVLFGETS